MREIHLLNPMANAFGGSEQRTLALAELLGSRAKVRIWSVGPPDRRLHSRTPITPTDVSKLRFPKGGTLVVMGCYFELPTWISVMRPERTIVVYNIPHLSQLQHAAYVLQAFGVGDVEVVAASEALAKQARELGLDVSGVEPSWIDLDRFQASTRSARNAFTVGRMSRDTKDKFHSEDPALFQRVAKSAQVRIMGGTILKEEVNGSPNIELLPAGAVPADKFLKGLDAFLYRTSETWAEAWGRVVAEALASGLPVVLDRQVGIAEVLDDEEDALLFQTTDEAIEKVCRLKEEPALRERLGRAARAKAERLCGSEARRKWLRYYAR